MGGGWINELSKKFKQNMYFSIFGFLLCSQFRKMPVAYIFTIACSENCLYNKDIKRHFHINTCSPDSHDHRRKYSLPSLNFENGLKFKTIKIKRKPLLDKKKQT